MVSPPHFDHEKLDVYQLELKEMLVRIVAMLTKLVERFDPDQYRVRENASTQGARFEDEHDDEHEDE
jgi:hypothetical protein